MEKWSYDEAREWFWVRTGVWSLPIAVISVIVLMFFWNYFVSGAEPKTIVEPNIWTCILIGVGITLLGVLAAFISLQFPWMRSGWKFGFFPNAIACALVAGVIAFLIGGVVLSFMQNDAFHRPPFALIDLTYKILELSVAMAVMWGIVIGSWFALRRDKYFIEDI